MKSPGKYFVLLLVGFSFLAAAGTFWKYSSSVFSTNHAVIINRDGRIEALFSPSITAKLHPRQHAKITLASAPETVLQAEIVMVVRGTVLLQLLEKPKVFSLGEACEVTIDTTIPDEVRSNE
ncbi:MAG: hypothetical protein FJ390_06280 [Verrucomicrobia bacterium]|nr:hypothetical protein [Verrucomicrobiota bacterium]